MFFCVCEVDRHGTEVLQRKGLRAETRVLVSTVQHFLPPYPPCSPRPLSPSSSQYPSQRSLSLSLPPRSTTSFLHPSPPLSIFTSPPPTPPPPFLFTTSPPLSISLDLFTSVGFLPPTARSGTNLTWCSSCFKKRKVFC